MRSQGNKIEKQKKLGWNTEHFIISIGKNHQLRRRFHRSRFARLLKMDAKYNKWRLIGCRKILILTVHVYLGDIIWDLSSVMILSF